MGEHVDTYLARADARARAGGGALAPVGDRHRAVRLVETDAAAVARGLAAGWLGEVDDGLRTSDPRGRVVPLLADDPPALVWDSLPLLAAYVELVEARYPVAALRCRTAEDELALDLAAVDEDGGVLVLGAVRPEPLHLSKLEALVPTLDGDPGPSPGGEDEARELAHRLWATRPPYLWLVAAGTRRAFRVTYGRTLRLAATRYLPHPEDLWPYGFDGPTPAVRRAAEVTVSTGSTSRGRAGLGG